MTITEFLLARIAEDESVAAAAGAEIVPYWGDPLTPVAQTAYHRLAERFTSVGVPISRVLAECEAKRRIVEYGRMARDLIPAGDSLDAYLAAINDALLALAQPYADHPDYEQEWAL